MNEAISEGWSSRTLDRNIASQYYYRLLQSQTKEAVSDEMQTLTADFQNDKLEFIKNSVVAEFLGLSSIVISLRPSWRPLSSRTYKNL